MYLGAPGASPFFLLFFLFARGSECARHFQEMHFSCGQQKSAPGPGGDPRAVKRRAHFLGERRALRTWSTASAWRSAPYGAFFLSRRSSFQAELIVLLVVELLVLVVLVLLALPVTGAATSWKWPHGGGRQCSMPRSRPPGGRRRASEGGRCSCVRDRGGMRRRAALAWHGKIRLRSRAGASESTVARRRRRPDWPSATSLSACPSLRQPAPGPPARARRRSD